MTIHRALASLVMAACLYLAIQAPSTLAHAELTSSDPPADGLAVTSPETITLSFSEEVEPTDPAPSITILDQAGNPVSESPLPIVESDDRRTLTAQVPELDPGTWTVSWTVTSATDGHTLAGTFAFRVGGGLPPGLAASPDELPATWAVFTRWLTFVGAATAAGLLLVGATLVSGDAPGSRWRRVRSVGILAGAGVALLATVLEPVFQWALDRPSDDASLPDMVRALPDGWWWRPWTLVPLVALAIAIAVPLRGRVPRQLAWAGTTLALGSILGLSMTSHAAGRATYREVAIGIDLAHQWSVALWTGGLVALVLWGITRHDGGGTLNLKRFSGAALVLFVVAVLTGVVNAGFVFPFVNTIRDDGFSVDVFDPLWTSNYGVILIVKVAILSVPFALAIYHRSHLARVAGETARIAHEWPGKLRQTIRWELAAVAIVIGGGVAMALSSPPAAETNALDKITLVASTSPTPGDDSLLVHLTIAPADSGDNDLTVRLTDWDGSAVATDPAPRVVLSFTSIDHGTESGGVATTPDPVTPGTYRSSGLGLSLDGWWQIDATIQVAGQQNQFATFYALLPDPNTQGFDAPPKPASDPDAEALYQTALDRMLTWERVRWTEDLSSGNDALVRANFAVVDGGDTGPSASSLEMVYSAGFQPLANGQPPRPPTYDSRSSVTVGDRSWLRTGNGDWLEETPSNISLPSSWGETYEGATSFRMGVTQTVDGRTLQAVTFYLPEQTGRAEAWLTWWIDTSTGDVVQVAMIARMHYMVWNYFDINGEVTIQPPTS